MTGTRNPKANPLDAGLLDFAQLEICATGRSAVHRRDPRVKLLVTLAFVVTVVSFHPYALSALMPLALYPLAVMAVAGVPVRLVWGKLLLAAPFALLIGLMNPLFDREPLWTLGTLTVTGGWVSLASILLRFILTLSAALTLIATTGFDAICMALARWHVPRPLVTQLSLLYRYIFVLTGEASRMMRAYALRAQPGRRPSIREFGSLAGNLLMRAYDRALRIHIAMLSRGFDGEMRVLRPMRLTRADAGYALGWIGFFALTRWHNLPQWLGQLVMGGAS